MSAYMDHEWREKVQAKLKLLDVPRAMNTEMERWRFEGAEKAASDILRDRVHVVYIARTWD